MNKTSSCIHQTSDAHEPCSSSKSSVMSASALFELVEAQIIAGYSAAALRQPANARVRGCACRASWAGKGRVPGNGARLRRSAASSESPAARAAAAEQHGQPRRRVLLLHNQHQRRPLQ